MMMLVLRTSVMARLWQRRTLPKFAWVVVALMPIIVTESQSFSISSPS